MPREQTIDDVHEGVVVQCWVAPRTWLGDGNSCCASFECRFSFVNKSFALVSRFLIRISVILCLDDISLIVSLRLLFFKKVIWLVWNCLGIRTMFAPWFLCVCMNVEFQVA